MRASTAERIGEPAEGAPGRARTTAQVSEAEGLRQRARERLREGLRQRGDRRWLRIMTLPAPLAAPSALLRGDARLRGLAGDGLHAVLWQPPEGGARCGLGAAWEAEVRGEGRIAQLREQLKVLGPRIMTDAAGEEAPRIFGGLAFAPGWRDAAGAPWRAFGDGRFFLPRWCYGRSGERAFLQLALRADGIGRDAALAELEAVLDALAEPAAAEQAGGEGPAHALESIDQMEPARWRDQVQAILGAIGRGECAKIVAARRAVVTAGAPLVDHLITDRLAREQPGCTVFALRCGPATFLGATPERLVARRGAEVRTEALAGTCGTLAGGEVLRQSAKDQAEHDLVVRDILARLQPLCAALPPPPAPTARPLRDVLHLHTPIEGRLRGPCHVLDLVQALHPTPAVAGAPAAKACQWIVQNEDDPRGWYAGPVGWLDVRGDGEFVVALRSGLIEGRRAHLYAGAGIVAGSDAAREYEETALKQRALLSALGAAP